MCLSANAALGDSLMPVTGRAGLSPTRQEQQKKQYEHCERDKRPPFTSLLLGVGHQVTREVPNHSVPEGQALIGVDESGSHQQGTEWSGDGTLPVDGLDLEPATTSRQLAEPVNRLSE